MRENDIRKAISIPKQVFHISDDEGNTKDFVIKKTDKRVLYTKDDIEAILEACQYVIKEALKAGEKITVRGFGSLELTYRKPLTVTNVLDGSKIEMDWRYVPKFICGNDLRRAAQVYEQAVKDRLANTPSQSFEPEETEE